MELSRKQAEALCADPAIGFTNAPTWSDERMQAKINKLHEFVDEDTEMASEKLQSLLIAVLKTVQEGDTVTLKQSITETRTEPVAEPSPKKRGRPRKEAVPEPEQNIPVPEEEPAEPEEESTSPKKPAPETKPKHNPTPPITRTEPKGRRYWCGYVLRKYGPDTPVSAEMMNEVSRLCGSENLVQTVQDLNAARLILQGYLSKD